MLNILSPTQTRRTQPCDYTANNNLQQMLLHRQIQNTKTKEDTNGYVEYIVGGTDY